MMNIAPLEVLRQVDQKYLHCRTYSDSGIIETTDLKGNSIFLSFRTWFVRPGYYRYEWQDWSPARKKSEEFSVLCWDGNKAYVSYPWRERTMEKELSMAVAGATGCSAAFELPS